MGPGNKRLIICCDGTWNEPDQKVDNNPADETEPTNVLKTVRGIAPVDDNNFPQVVYYDAGVGTRGFVDKFLGGVLGVGVSRNVQQAYRFIANNYHDGDELLLFGFSRGAYTVRSLAGFIGTAGLLEKENLRFVPEAYAFYRLPPNKRAGSRPERRLKRLKRPPRTGIPIEFIGVWDTVGALGAPTPILGRLTRRVVSFHDTQLGKDVKHAYQALAVDERRRPFQPDLWTGDPAPCQTIRQVWFAGVHSNVGGSYRNTGLSDIALKWLAGRAARHGLEFTEAFKSFLEDQSGTAEQGRLEDSFSFVYKALGAFGVRPYVREIGLNQHGKIRRQDWKVPGEMVHPSAVAAMGKPFAGNADDKPYGPENLKKALDDGLPVWTTDGTVSSDDAAADHGASDGSE